MISCTDMMSKPNSSSFNRNVTSWLSSFTPADSCRVSFSITKSPLTRTLYWLPVLQFIGLRRDVLDGLGDLLGSLQSLLGGPGRLGGGARSLLGCGCDLLTGLAGLFESGGDLAGSFRDFPNVLHDHIAIFRHPIEVR